MSGRSAARRSFSSDGSFWSPLMLLRTRVGPSPGAKALLKGVDEAERVFALEHAEEVEGEEEDEAFRETELRPRHGFHLRRLDAERQRQHGPDVAAATASATKSPSDQTSSTT
jgi:hypothetical protein